MTIGIHPLDPTSPVGMLRALVGDTATTPHAYRLDLANYAVWSDAVLEAALAGADDNLYRAAGSLYRTLAAQYIQQGKSIRTDDLAIDTRGRGTDLLKLADSFYAQADAAVVEGGGDSFQIVGFSGRPNRSIVRPEATPYAWRP